MPSPHAGEQERLTRIGSCEGTAKGESPQQKRMVIDGLFKPQVCFFKE